MELQELSRRLAVPEGSRFIPDPHRPACLSVGRMAGRRRGGRRAPSSFQGQLLPPSGSAPHLRKAEPQVRAGLGSQVEGSGSGWVFPEAALKGGASLQGAGVGLA